MTEKNNEIGANTPETLGFNPYRISENMHEIGPQLPAITYAEAVERIEGYQDEWFQELQKWQGRFYSAKVLFVGLPVLISTWISFDYGIDAAIIALVAMYIFTLIAYFRAKKWMQGKEFECYSNIKENIYIYSEKPKDTTVYSRQIEFEKKIMDSANQSYPMVIGIYFADHENANERWSVEWPERLLREILEDRAKRHKELGKKDPVWYKKHILKQEGL